MKIRSSFSRTLITLLSVFAVTTVIMLLSSCQGTGSKKTIEFDSTLGLKDYYKDYFPIGVAVSPRSLEGVQGEFIKKFNSLTPENVMKPALIQPEEGKF